ncbi:hypothetical protein Ndes2526B_g06639 [Nannochloris sp. 'desiccata']|nr:putative Syntaxin-binding protein 5 [Chlorella desiccata (nom. nud.)]
MANKESRFFADTTRHLARKLNHQVSRVRDPSGFPEDVLDADQIDIQFLQHIGFPESADGVAYEPVQKLLAVSTSDGVIKLIGKHGVEAALRSGSASPTKYIGFLRHRGALLRITQAGNVELFSVPGRRLLSNVTIPDDAVNTVAVVPGGPYVMLGCESGNCKVVLVSSRTGTSGGGVDNGTDPAAGLAIQPYQILGEDLDASGGVVALAMTRNSDRPLALILHRNSGAIVWDIRAERVISSAPDDEDDPSKPTSACWVGDRGNCYAVGYDDGSILVWGVPASALKMNTTGRVTASEDSVIVMSLRVTPDNTGTLNTNPSSCTLRTKNTCSSAPVRSLTFLPGAEGTPGGEDCLLVCGGQAASDPDMLTLLPLDPQGDIPPSTVPWFGTLKAHALMPTVANTGSSTSRNTALDIGGGTQKHTSVGGCTDTSTSTIGVVSDDHYDALMVLTEGGQLVVHDLREWHPHPLTLPLQELPPISASKFVPTVSADQAAALTIEGPSKRVQHALTLPALLELRVNNSGNSRINIVTSDWPFTGGEAAVCDVKTINSGCHPSALLMTGHRDGKIRVWDSTAQVPVLITTVPSSGAIAATAAASGQQQERLRAVTCFDVCPASGLLAVGHAGGDVRVYQFTDRPQSVRRASIDESLVPYDTMLVQPAGFQYILKYSTHSVDCTAVSLASKMRLLAVGDCHGGVSALDLTAPQRLFQTIPVAGEAVAKLAVGLAAAAAGGGGGGGSSSKSDATTMASVAGSIGTHTTIPATAETTTGANTSVSSPKSSRDRGEDVYLFVASQDSSLTMLALHSGEPASRTLSPKNPSRPLDLALLDAQGVPLLPLQGSVFLPWADNNAASAPRSLSMMKVKRMDTSSSTGGRRRSTADLGGAGVERFSTDQQNCVTPRGGGGRASQSRTLPLSSNQNDPMRPSTSASLEIHTLPSDEDEDEDDEDLDAALNAAAAAVDAETSAVRTSRFSIFRKRSPSPERKGGRTSNASQNNVPVNNSIPGGGSGAEGEDFMPELALSPPAPDGAAAASPRSLGYDIDDNFDRDHIALITEDSQEAVSCGNLDDEYGIDTSSNLFGGLTTKLDTADGTAIGDSVGAFFTSGNPGAAMAVDYPYIDCGLEENLSFAAVEYVLLPTADYLRVYSVESVRLGDRTTNKKQKIDPGAVFAGVFLSESGPGVVSISTEGGINVHSVPNLALLVSKPLSASDVLGFPWRVPDAAESSSTAGAWTCSLEGQLLLTAPGNEMARLLVVKDTCVPAGAASTFDWRLAKAARAASNAISSLPRTDRSNSTGTTLPYSTSSRSSSIDTQAGINVAPPMGGAGAAGQNFISQVKGAAAAATGAVIQELDRVRAGVLPRRELPTLRTLFETPVESLLIEDDIDYMPEEEEGGGVGSIHVGRGQEDNSVSGVHNSNNRVAAAGAAAATAAVAAAGKAKDKAGYLANAAFQGAATGGAKLKSLVPLGRRNSEEVDPLESVKMKESMARERRNDLLGTPGGSTPSPYGGTATASSRATPKGRGGSSNKNTTTDGAQRLHRRTTSEIKRTYGHTRSQDAKVTMERNRALLAERGQKLANLEEQAAVMRGDAEDFAGMAAELEAAFANRKWWQF